jgi:hypothetical protein
VERKAASERGEDGGENGDEAMHFASTNSALIVEALWQTSLLDIEFTLRKCVSSPPLRYSHYHHSRN